MDSPPPDDEAERVQALVRGQLGGRVRDFRVLAREDGLVLQGKTDNYYLKQLAQEKVFAATGRRVAANEIRVGRPPAAAVRPARRKPNRPEGAAMPTLRELMGRILADGKVDGPDLTALGELVYTDGQVSRFEAECLVELHRRVERVTPAFERFFYLAIKRHVMADGVIDPEEAAWLRRVVYADGRVEERERKLVRELKGEAAATCPEFDALCADCTP